jgi:uncharacterized membrane protein
MTIRPDVLLAILAMAVLTYACRAGGYAILRATRVPPFVERMLQHLPGALFAAYVTPPLLAGGPSGWIGAAATVALQLTTKSLALAVLGGVGAVWGAQLLGL